MIQVRIPGATKYATSKEIEKKKTLTPRKKIQESSHFRWPAELDRNAFGLLGDQTNTHGIG
jgi:hypothetical protein